jgi:hypothetical protein
MEITLSENERQVIQLWAEKNMHGGHWGDGDIEIPEERILLSKLQRMNTSMNHTVNLTETEARIILMWSRSTLGIHNLEEDSVIRKVSSRLKPQQ